MTDLAISVKELSKRFRLPLDGSTTLKYRITHLKSAGRFVDYPALNAVSFDCSRGEFLGITGPNGCGKSTLLKILSRIYKADSGSVEVNGRVSPFLELGVGFNPELTARENIFLGGAVLGLTKAQLTGRVDPILNFAELHQFADQKLKNFSSGMGVRLAFSVAIQADADILLMDEVLAVGDARFQEKCFEVFADYKKKKKTIVLVSHDLTSLEAYCDRVLLLEEGQLVADGPGHEVISQYRRHVGARSGADLEAQELSNTGAGEQRWGDRALEITRVRILDREGNNCHTFVTGDTMTIAVDYEVHQQVDEFVCGLAVGRTDGLHVAGVNTKTNQRITGPPGGTTGTIEYQIDSVNLLTSNYLLTVALHDWTGNHQYDHRVDVSSFRVTDDSGRTGMMELGGVWKVPSSVLRETKAS